MKWSLVMCLAIPGRLVEIYEEAGMKMGNLDYNGTINKPEDEDRRACWSHSPFMFNTFPD